MSSQQQQLLDLELLNVRKFFERNKDKGGKCYFRLYCVKKKNQEPQTKSFKTCNFHSEDIEDSLEILERDIQLHGPYCPQYMVLKHMTSKSDGHAISYIFKNPLYLNESYFNKNLIAGQNQSMDVWGKMFEMQKDFNDRISKSERKLMEEKHDRQLEYFKEAIEGIKNSQKTFSDTVKGFLESDVGKQMGAALIGVVTARMTQPQPYYHPQPQPQPQPQQQAIDLTKPVEKGEQSQDKTQVSEQDSLTKSMKKIRGVFGNDFVQVLANLANYCELNPEGAQGMFNAKQTVENGEA